MQTSSSSTSSSEPLAPAHLPGLVRTGVVAVLVVLGAELAARVILGPDDDWKFWRMPVGERIDILEARSEAPEVLIIGDSTAASNLVPADFIEASGHTAYNLGTRGNMLGSFEPTMIETVLPALKNQPRAFVVSFTPQTYGNLPFFEDVASQVNNSLFARSARGELVWGDWFALARFKHRIRAQLDHQANDPTFDSAHGWQPFSVTEAQKRPNAKTRVPRAPWSRPQKKQRGRVRRIVPEKLDVLDQLGALAGERPVIWIVPPAGRANVPLVRALEQRAPANVQIWDYSATGYARAEGAHLEDEAAREFTRAVAERFRSQGVLDR